MSGSTWAAARAAFNDAVDYVESLFDDPIDVFIDVEMASLPAGILAGTGFAAVQASYSTTRTRMLADNDSGSESIVDTLPSSITWAANTGFTVSANTALATSNALALGFTVADSLRGNSAFDVGDLRDGNFQFNSTVAWDFDPANGIAANTTDFTSTAVHEILHALGFSSSVDSEIALLADGQTTGTLFATVLDMFRLKPVADRSGTTFANAPRILQTGNVYSGAVTFDGSYDSSGITGFPKTLSTGDIPMSSGGQGFGDGFQASHWKDDSIINRQIGVMDPEANGTEITETKVIDHRVMGLIGWDATSQAFAVLGSTSKKVSVQGSAGGDTITVAKSDNVVRVTVNGIDSYFDG